MKLESIHAEIYTVDNFFNIDYCKMVIKSCKNNFIRSQVLTDEGKATHEIRTSSTCKLSLCDPRISKQTEDKIYKLELGNSIHYVPLWHNELYFDVSDNDLIVQIIPDIDSNIVIGPNNDIAMDYELHLLDAYRNETKDIYMGGSKFTINTNELKLTEQKQVFTFKNRGLLRIDTKDIFDSSKRGDVYIAIKLIPGKYI